MPPEAAGINIAFKTGKASWPITASEEFCGDFSQRIEVEMDNHPQLTLQ